MKQNADLELLPIRAWKHVKNNGINATIAKSKTSVFLRKEHLWAKYSCHMPGPTNDLEIRFFAGIRTGHHAIINWIRSQIPGRQCFLNNCIPNQNPLESAITGESFIRVKGKEHRYINWERERNGQLSKKGTLLYNFENVKVEDVLTPRFYQLHDEWIGTSKRELNILILRDPYNQFASILKWVRGSNNPIDPSILKHSTEIWKNHAKEFLNTTNNLGNSKIIVSYNEWFASEDYRKNLSKALQLKWNDASINTVAEFGPTRWGDSFDGLKYQGRANEMKVFDRWTQFSNDKQYLSLFEDREIVEMGKEIFGFVPQPLK